MASSLTFGTCGDAIAYLKTRIQQTEKQEIILSNESTIGSRRPVVAR
jgi:hypothetical protein